MLDLSRGSLVLASQETLCLLEQDTSVVLVQLRKRHNMNGMLWTGA